MISFTTITIISSSYIKIYKTILVLNKNSIIIIIIIIIIITATTIFNSIFCNSILNSFSK